MFNMGLTEIVIIFLIILILFGAKKIPQLGSGLGEGIRNFTKSLKGSSEEDKKEELKSEKTDKKETGANAK